MKTSILSLQFMLMLCVFAPNTIRAQQPPEASMENPSYGLAHEVPHHEQAEIKIIHIRDRPLIQGTINGKRAYFLLDTGASISMLHVKRARHYDFSVRPHSSSDHQAVIQNFEGVRTATQHIDNARVELGSLYVRIPLQGFDMEPVVQNVKARTGIRIAGIIGSDVMRQYKFLINFAKRRIAYNNPQTR